MNIAFEGHSYSGKTTLLNYLRDNEDKNIIAEHDIYAGGIENYPPFPPVTFEMAKDNVDFFANLEVRRAHDATNLDGESFFDRSFMSVILFQKFMRSLAISGQFDAYEYARGVFKDLLVREQIVFPDFLVFVSCESEEEYKDRYSREISVGLLRTDNAIKFFGNEYARICGVFEGRGRLLRVISRNGVASLRENAVLIRKIDATPASIDEKNDMITEIIETI